MVVREIEVADKLVCVSQIADKRAVIGYSGKQDEPFRIQVPVVSFRKYGFRRAV